MKYLIITLLALLLLPIVYAACYVPVNDETFSTPGVYTFCLEHYNFTGGINVQTSNITIDCNGSTLDRAYPYDGVGIAVTNAFSNITIQNCIITGYKYAGITMSNAGTPAYRINGVIIKNNVISEVSNATGMFLWGLDNFEIYNNTIYNMWDDGSGGCGAHGIYLSADSEVASNNTVNGSIHNNLIYNMTGGTALKNNNKYTMHNVRVYDNYIENLTYVINRCSVGIHLANTNNFTVYNNTLRNIGGSGIVIDHGDTSITELSNGADNTTVHDNTLFNITTDYGIEVRQYADNNYLYANNFDTIENAEYYLSTGINNLFYEADSIRFIKWSVYHGYMLYLNFTGAKNFSISGDLFNFSMKNHDGGWGVYNDVRNNSVILENNVYLYSKNLVTTNPITIGDFVTGLSINNVSATMLNGTAARIVWNTNALSNSSANYGLNLSLGSSYSYNDSNTSHVMTINGLSTGIWYFNLTSRNSTDTAVYGVGNVTITNAECLAQPYVTCKIDGVCYDTSNTACTRYVDY